MISASSSGRRKDLCYGYDLHRIAHGAFIALHAFGEAGLQVAMESTLFKLIGGINSRVASGVDYRKVLDFIFGALEAVIPYDRMGIALLSGAEGSQHLKLEWVRSKIPYSHLDLSYSASIAESSLETLLRTNTPRILNDLIKYAALHPESESTKLALLDGIRSSLTCPLRAGNKPIGVLFFSSARTNAYQGAHIETFASIAEELAVIVDHGRLKNAAEQGMNQSRDIKMLLHDLRSPLGIIQGFVQASYEETWFKDLSDENKKVFEIILRNSQQMFGLLNEVLEVSVLSADADDLVKSEVNMNDFFLEMRNFGQIVAARKEIEFSSGLSVDDEEAVLFDATRIRRVLENLLTNAMKFTDRGQHVRMQLDCRGQKLHATVTDTGHGILESELPKLFTDFGVTTTKSTEGETSVGLGLAIAKKIVEQHNGEITVQSVAGRGSTFTFWIPTS